MRSIPRWIGTKLQLRDLPSSQPDRLAANGIALVLSPGPTFAGLRKDKETGQLLAAPFHLALPASSSSFFIRKPSNVIAPAH